MQNKIPYNTGKVQIGINYQRPYRIDISRDMESLQIGLLHPAEKRALAGVKLLIILAMGAMVGLAIAWMI